MTILHCWLFIERMKTRKSVSEIEFSQGRWPAKHHKVASFTKLHLNNLENLIHSPRIFDPVGHFFGDSISISALLIFHSRRDSMYAFGRGGRGGLLLYKFHFHCKFACSFVNVCANLDVHYACAEVVSDCSIFPTSNKREPRSDEIVSGHSALYFVLCNVRATSYAPPGVLKLWGAIAKKILSNHARMNILNNYSNRVH